MNKNNNSKSKETPESEKELFSKMGIDIESERLSIDFAKTKEFFNGLKAKMEDTSKNIEKSLNEKALDLKENLGIKVDNEHIEVNFGEAKNFIADLGEKIEEFLASLERSVDKYNKKS